jgi:glycosyltransferase involved in cell wall biosynthesis
MNILHISAYDKTGGAARAAHRLHSGLRQIDQDSSMFVEQRSFNEPSIITFSPPMALLKRLHRRLRREWITRSFRRYRTSLPPDYELFSDDRTQYSLTLLDQLPPCDVINLHWIAGFIDLHFFFSRLPQHIPVVWTLHDMNAFTGGCHYNHGCSKFRNQCGSCPQLGSSKRTDLSYQIWKRKRSVYSQIKPEDLHIVALNHWMAKEVKQSVLLQDFPVSTIPNGLETDIFTPIDGGIARDALEIPYDAKVILFCADWLANQRKGFALLTQAMADIGSYKDLYLMSVGVGDSPVNSTVPYLNLGHFKNDRLLSLAYSAADIFVIPSLQDNLPNTVMESMACGTPVVGFDVGGIPDMVRPGLTGFLAPPGDINALRSSIIQLIKDDELVKEMAENCRQIAVKEYTLEVQAGRYLELYKQILDHSNGYSH